MKVLLISANKLQVPYPVYPLGLEHVAGALKVRHQVRILDLCESGKNDALEPAIEQFGPDLVGLGLRNIDNTDITDTQSFLADYEDILRRIRKTTRAPVVLGGSGFTIFPQHLLAHLGADYGMVGEGERLLDLANVLEDGGEPGHIPGLMRPGDGRPRAEPWPGPFSRNPELHPGVDFYLSRGGMLNLQTKRGCPYRCIYCTYPHIEGRTLRRIPPDEVGRTARRLQEAGARYLFITDATFNSDFEHNQAVARALGRAGVTIPWGAFFAPLEAPDGYFETLVERGLTHVEFGTESLCEPVLRAFRKPFRVDEVFRAHDQALEADLHVAHYFMLGGPGETPETVETTLRHAAQLERTVRFFFCGVRIYPNTDLHDLALAEGRVSRDMLLLEPTFYLPAGLDGKSVEARVTAAAGGRLDWVVGSGGTRMARLVSLMYRRGHTGPLWEKLIR